MSETTVPSELATRREWIGLAVLALPTLLLSLDASVLYLALPVLSADLGASGVEQLWILDIYSFLLAGFLITMGTLGDRIGRRRLLMIGGGAFGLASILAAYSTSAEMLIVSRALLGIAGATLMPSTMALIRNMFHNQGQMARAIGIWFSCFMGGALLGPVVGGVLMEHFWWGSAFLLGVPVIVLLLALAPVLLPEYRDESAGRIDLPSVLLSLGAVLATVWGVKELARSGIGLLPMLAMGAGAMVGAVFLRRQRGLPDPLLDLRLFRLPRFTAALVVMLTGGVVMAGVSLQAALYLQTVEELSPLHAGLWLIPQNVAMIIGLNGAPRIAERITASRTMGVGLALSAVGLFVMARSDSADGVGELVAGLTLASFGMGLPMALTMNLMMAAAPPERAGSVASISETSGEAGIAVGIATLGSLGTLIYRRELEAGLPTGVPADVVVQAHQSVGSAVAAGQQLAGQLGADVVNAAKVAFTSGLQVVAMVGAFIILGSAVLAVTVLRRDATTAEVSPSEPVP